MAVEAQNLNLFPSQLIGNREIMEGNLNVYNGPLGYGFPPPLSGATTDTLFFPMYGSAITDSVPAPKSTALKADSGLTYALPVSRKRTRDSTNPLISFPNAQILNHSNNHTNNCGGFFTFLGEDISLQIQQQQLEIHDLITQHAEKVRLKMEEQRKSYSRRIMAAVEEGITKKLRAREEEVQKIGRLNWALEERVRSLCVENQLWRDLAQTNEATANALRNNLEQVLGHVNDRGGALHEVALMDDAQSCCGSNYVGGAGGVDEKKQTVADRGDDRMVVNKDKYFDNKMCRQCGKEESSVLLLPCRHLCLCTVCASSAVACPVCNTLKNVSLRVIMSG